MLSARTANADPGETWDLPRESDYDKEGRPHAILSPVLQDVIPGVVVYGSTSSKPATEYRAHYCTVRKDALGAKGNGLWRDETHFYTSKIFYVFADDLEARRGRLSELDWVRVKRDIKKALGFGEKSAKTALADGMLLADGSWRGEVVRIPKSIEDETGFQFAIVMTSHQHSSKEYWQTVVPLGAPQSPQDSTSSDPFDLPVGCQEWLVALQGDTVNWVVAPHYTFTVFQARERIRKMGIVAPDSFIEAIEKEMERNWRLPAL